MKLNIADLDFTSIKRNLIDYYKTQPAFKDFNFEASGLNILMDALAYTSFMNGYYLNMTANEMFLDTAQLRKNVVAIAKTLNYIPRRITGSTTTLNFSLKDDYATSLTHGEVIDIPAFTNFRSGGMNFMTLTAYQLTSSNGYSFPDVLVRQGEHFQETVAGIGLANQTIVIEQTNIDNDTLKIFVDGVEWSHNNNVTTFDENTEVYSVEINSLGYLKIIFGDGIIGKIPPLGSEIDISYSVTMGEEGNNLSFFTLASVLSDNTGGTYDDSCFDCVCNSPTVGGNGEETLTSIKTNAPIFYESQGRLVTKKDYEAFLRRHQLVDDVCVYGGSEDQVNPFYGMVYIAVRPVGGVLNLTDAEKTILGEYINERNILTVHPNFVDVDYIYLDVTGDVFYDQRFESNLSGIKNGVLSAINTFFAEESKFDNVFKVARLTTEINSLETVENTLLKIYPFVKFQKNATGAYVFQLGNELDSVVCYTGGDAAFVDDGSGNLINAKTKTVMGRVDYENGIVEVFPGYEIPEIADGVDIRLNFQTKTGDVHYRNNRSVTIGDTSLVYTRYLVRR